ncbi:DUF397 domain-containing protein [Streptomyces sp. NPDC048436]|uniref:DUF397 domain-containing protein n=1 Tax=Streptomyces sp. NPDC048436 TaxID=3365550 RepID=UPI0037135723
MIRPLHWQKSSFSGGGEGNTCVEVASAGNHIRLRESDTPAIELALPATQLACLIRTLKGHPADTVALP